MPIIRSIIDIGNRRAVTIPKSWITNAEEQTGKKVIAIALDINDSITLQPIFEKTIKPTNQQNASKQKSPNQF